MLGGELLLHRLSRVLICSQTSHLSAPCCHGDGVGAAPFLGCSGLFFPDVLLLLCRPYFEMKAKYYLQLEVMSQPLASSDCSDLSEASTPCLLINIVEPEEECG